MSIKNALQEAVTKALPDLAVVIGWGAGPDALNQAPLFMRNAEDAARCETGFLSVQNPALFLPEYKGSKIGLVVKGCDSLSVGRLLAEGLVKREEVFLIGFPCQGVIDHHKLAEALKGKAEPGTCTGMKEEGDSLVVSFPGQEIRIAKADVTAEKCSRCRYPNAVDPDVFVGEKREPVAEEDSFDDLARFEALPLEERKAFWEKEMSRCIRCYACRNACPLCVCREVCVATARDPHWITQADGVRDKLFFQIIHASHLAGRCTGCGECQRACPAGIPVLLLKRSLTRSVESLFGYRAGVHADELSPLMTFNVDEPKIKEREW